VTRVQTSEAGPALPGGPADAAAVTPPDPAPATGRAAPSGATGCARGASTAVDTPSTATGRTPRWAGFRGRGEGRVIPAAAVAGAALAAGLVWLIAPGSAGGPATIAVTAHHSRFEPDRITVKPGSTVRFVVHNSDPIDHEFIIGPPAVQELHERGTPHVHTGVVPGEITVPAGATVETSWTFGPAGSPPVAYGCHLAGHWAYGMHGLAVIR
jgi:uncharacterized cupredoxin-like copper-binding protein